MPSLEDFRTKMNGDEESRQAAMREYVVNVNSASLDGDWGTIQACREQDVAFDFSGLNVITMRAAEPGDARTRRIWYLPWCSTGATMASLGRDGPALFSTSQLDGCRFMIEYTDASRTAATVLHVSGRLGGTTNQLSPQRDAAERATLGRRPTGPLVRRYSSSDFARNGSAGLRATKALKALADNQTILYSGNKAFIWGFRRKNGVWDFVAHEISHHFETGDTGLGFKRLTG